MNTSPLPPRPASLTRQAFHRQPRSTLIGRGLLSAARQVSAGVQSGLRALAHRLSAPRAGLATRRVDGPALSSRSVQSLPQSPTRLSPAPAPRPAINDSELNASLIHYLNAESTQPGLVFRESNHLTRGVKDNLLQSADRQALDGFAQELLVTAQEMLHQVKLPAGSSPDAVKCRRELAALMAVNAITSQPGWQSSVISEATKQRLKGISDGVQREDRDKILDGFYRNVVFLQGLTPCITAKVQDPSFPEDTRELYKVVARVLQFCANGQVPGDKFGQYWNKPGSGQGKIPEAEVALSSYQTLVDRFSDLRSSLHPATAAADSKSEA